MNSTPRFVRCPRCGSIWTYACGGTDLWECRQCHHLFPVECDAPPATRQKPSVAG